MNVLDALFKKEEQEIDTFAGVLKDKGVLLEQEKVDMFSSEQPMSPGEPPAFVDQIQGFVQINHGWHADDYVWHISPAHFKKPWKISIERVVYVIAHLINEVVPSNVEVKIWLPYADWEIKEVTFKAFGLKDVWSVSQKSIDQLNERLFQALNQVV